MRMQRVRKSCVSSMLKSLSCNLKLLLQVSLVELISRFLTLQSICSVWWYVILMIDCRYFIILNWFVNDFSCYYLNYVLIIFLVCCIVDSIMNISFPDFDDFGYLDDPFISGDKLILKDYFTGAVISFMSLILCDGWNSCAFVGKNDMFHLSFLCDIC